MRFGLALRIAVSMWSTVSVPVLWAASPASRPNPNDACSLLTARQIARSTGLTVDAGERGLPIPGAIGSCWWRAADGTRIVVTVADAPHMQVTMQSQAQTGADALPGLGNAAVGTAGTDETGGGYNISVVDHHGGVAVSILGAAGTSDRAIALAKLVEQTRNKSAGR